MSQGGIFLVDGGLPEGGAIDPSDRLRGSLLVEWSTPGQFVGRPATSGALSVEQR